MTKQEAEDALRVAEADYASANKAYQASWPRDVKLRKKVDQIWNLVMAESGSGDLIQAMPVLEKFVGARAALVRAETETGEFLAVREDAYKTLLAARALVDAL